MSKLLKVTAMTGLLTLVKMAIGFIIAKVVAIYAGPSGMAMLGQVQSLVNGFNGVINAPVSNGVVRYTAEFNEQGYEACSPWWKAALHWALILSCILIPVGLISAQSLSLFLFREQSYKWIIYVTVIALPLTAIGSLVNSVINGQQRYKLYVTLGMVSAIVSGTCMIILIIYANLNGALLSAALQSALIGLVLILFSLRQPWLKFRYWWGLAPKQAYRAIGGYILMASATALAMPVSLVLLRNILVSHVGWDLAGQWQAVWKISEVYLGVCTMALSAYYLPKLSTIKGFENTKLEIKNTAKVILPLVTIMAVCIYFLRDISITILFTEQFRQARDLFAIQLIGDVIKIASWLYAFPMIARNATKWFISTELIFSSTFVILGYFFIKKFGLQGANIAYLLNYVIYLLFMVFNLKRFSS
ncbi:MULTISPECIES: O-antigen translocase [unclassified Serratia (in: enterobacteria)]|uniref:O-antigen translocase n=1 Tax=unclassified Serratia (in: enterobacteria) TaxID=2647522 RepID=UPI003075FE9E